MTTTTVNIRYSSIDSKQCCLVVFRCSSYVFSEWSVLVCCCFVKRKHDPDYDIILLYYKELMNIFSRETFYTSKNQNRFQFASLVTEMEKVLFVVSFDRDLLLLAGNGHAWWWARYANKVCEDQVYGRETEGCMVVVVAFMYGHGWPPWSVNKKL